MFLSNFIQYFCCSKKEIDTFHRVNEQIHILHFAVHFLRFVTRRAYRWPMCTRLSESSQKRFHAAKNATKLYTGTQVSWIGSKTSFICSAPRRHDEVVAR